MKARRESLFSTYGSQKTIIRLPVEHAKRESFCRGSRKLGRSSTDPVYGYGGASLHECPGAGVRDICIYIYIYARPDSKPDHIKKAPNVTTEIAELAFCARQVDNSRNSAKISRKK